MVAMVGSARAGRRNDKRDRRGRTAALMLVALALSGVAVAASRFATNVAPAGSSLSRWIKLFAGSQTKVLPRCGGGKRSAV